MLDLHRQWEAIIFETKENYPCNRIFFAGAVMHSTLINSVVMGTAGRMNAAAHAAANHFEMMGTRFSSSFFFSRYSPRLFWHSGLTNSDVRTAVSTNINYIHAYVLMYMHLCRAFRCATNTYDRDYIQVAFFYSDFRRPKNHDVSHNDNSISRYFRAGRQIHYYSMSNGTSQRRNLL